MPNVKIYVDETLYPEVRAPVMAALMPIRDLLCAGFEVDPPACQFAVIAVGAMPDLPQVNIELHILPKPERTRDVVLSVCTRLREILAEATAAHVAVRVMTLDPLTYVALK